MPTFIRKPLAAIAVAVAAVFGATALAKSGSSSSSSSSGAPTAPRGAPQQGTVVTGATADKVKAAALAKYPGTIEGIVKLSNGSYLAHVIRADKTEVHVLVSATFQVTGAQQRPPGQAPPRTPSPTAPGSSTGATT